MDNEQISARSCQVCESPAVHKCGACRAIYYCSKEHQRAHWKLHKSECRPFRICEDAKLGRHLVATRSIQCGEIILKEAPLIWGPSQNSIPICLGCGRGISEGNSRPCGACGWPVCGDLCEKAPGHLPECRYTSQRGDKVSIKEYGIPHPIYKCITVLRCLYQKQFLPKVWKKLAPLEAHQTVRQSLPSYDSDRIMVAEFIRRFFKLSSTFTEDEIMQICGIVTVNSHEVPLTEPAYIAIYAIGSLIEHNCSANCSKSFTNSGELIISAAQPITEGQHLSISYTDQLWGTPSRRHHLQETKFFSCECSRCLDPTEFGTYFSALKCQQPQCSGALLPKNFTSSALLDWTCHLCLTPTTAYSAHDLLERVGRDLADLDRSNPADLKKFLATYKSYLSPDHFYLVDAQNALGHVLGAARGLAALAADDLALKLKLCRRLADLCGRVARAERRTLGTLLFELHAACAEVARRKGLESRDADAIRADLVESREVLVEAVECLKWEPSELPEGKILGQARQNLKDIDLVLRSIHQSVGDSPF